MSSIAFQTALTWFLITLLAAYYAAELYKLWRR
jgi:hypothetical protein